MSYYIYRITNEINGKTYVGKHKYTDINDNYMGSGILLGRAKNKYGIENFSKTLITVCADIFEANILEKYYIEKERKTNTKGVYNISDGGDGGESVAKCSTKEGRERGARIRSKQFYENYEERVEIIRKGIEKRIEKVKISSYWNKWISYNCGILLEHEHSRISSFKRQELLATGWSYSNESKAKISASMKEWWAKQEDKTICSRSSREDVKKKISVSRKEYCKNHAMKWFNNGSIETLAEECPAGYIKGRLPRRVSKLSM